MPYDISEHIHRFSSWAASRAASTKTCRFDVETGKQILEDVGLKQYVRNPDALPEADEFDLQHRGWREVAIAAANRRGLTFTHGIAAKLINCYLKAALVCGGLEQHAKVAGLHPPIDALLLESLHRSGVGGQTYAPAWATARGARWSKLGSDQYEAVIQAIRAVTSAAGMWTIEEHWRGYQ